jgi:hypothetical protein
MSNYNKLKEEHEIFDFLIKSKYAKDLSYDYADNRCLYLNQDIDIQVFRTELQYKADTVFLNGENFNYALQRVCKHLTPKEDNVLDSYTLSVLQILQSNKLNNKEEIQIKEILEQLNISKILYKSEEQKVAKSLKQLGYVSKLLKNETGKYRAWIKVEQGRTTPLIDLEALLQEERTRVTRLNLLLDEHTKLANKQKEELELSKQENTKLLNTNLELANKIKELEAKLTEHNKVEDRFSTPNRFTRTPLDDLD